MRIVPRPTLLHHFGVQVRTRTTVPCVFFHRDAAVVTKTWAEVAADVAQFRAALAALGAKRGDRTAIFSANRYEWLVADLAILGLGAVNVPEHNSLTGPQARFQIVDAEATILLVGGDEHLTKLAAAEPLPSHIRIASFDKTTVPLGKRPIPQLADLAGPTEYVDPTDLAADDLATILYTSGTTGEPKGVMLTHGNLTTNAEAVVVEFHGSNVTREGELLDRRLNLLPFSHIFARTCDLYTWIVAGNELALADAPQTVVADCTTFQPTLINAVPYFYEKVMRLLSESGMADEPDVLPQLLGGKVRNCCSGGAPLPNHVAKFYVDRGVLLTQGYGLTETSPVITMNSPTVYRHGTVGRPLPGVEVQIAEDGEILTRGPHVMRGYWNLPAETAAALAGGWFHTGDLGSLDDDGYLRITGRKKELIVTSGGKKVVPSVVEALLAADPLVKQVVVVGDRRNYLSALVVCDDALLEAAVKEAGLNVESKKMYADPRVAELVAARLRPRLSHLSHYEQVQKVALLDREFSVAKEELTLTMKIRREQIAENFAEVIERLYTSA